MLELLVKRRSIRKFKDADVEKEKVDKLVKAALLSPTAKNLQDWEFVVIDDRETLYKLSQSRDRSSAFLKGAPLGIVVLGESERNDVWIEDASIASILIQMTAESLGLGSCWIQMRNRQHNDNKTAEEYVREVLGIPGNLKVESIIAIGYPAESKPPHNDDELRYEKVFKNKYGNSY
jgi:nitroreductase